MANCFDYRAQPDLEGLHSSNIRTSVFFSLLALAATQLAQSTHQSRWAAFLAAHDQAVLGLGCAGTDIDDWPWAADSFEADKAYLLASIALARTDQPWATLDYESHAELLRPDFQVLENLISAFDIQHTNCQKTLAERWWNTPEHPERCSKHGIYLHDSSCILCNDC